MQKQECYKLSDICDQICDGVHNTVIDTPTGDYYLLSAKNIKNGKITISDDERRISSDTYDKLHKRTQMAKGDILLTTVGASIGDVAIVRDEKPNYEFQRSVGIFKPKSNVVVPDYLFYIFQSESFQQYLYNNATGAAQPCLFLGFLKKIKVSIPEFSVQQNIVDGIYSYDKLIENNSKRITLLEQMAENLYQEWFVRFRFPGHEDAEFEGGMPATWSVVKIGDRFDTVLGGTPSREKPEYWDGEIPWINSGAVNNSRITSGSEYITEIGYNKSATTMLPIHTTVIAITGATLGQVSFTEIEVCTNQSVVGIYDEKRLYSYYLFGVMQQNIADIINYASGGAQQHINKEVVNKYKVLLPDSELIKKYNKLVSPMFDEIRITMAKNENLIKQRDLLLPRLMSGKLEVK